MIKLPLSQSEYRQLELVETSRTRQILIWINQVFGSVAILLQKSLLQTTEVQVWQSRDRSGKLWWCAYDPATGRSLHQVTEAEICCWLERRYLT
ncbi:MAG: hypothetical protein HC886_04690 [Leptolyngbyaceae cyanobacterium SM1_1_3]|nr:hypothetical protein [Leptolyngbyaceae cyanobacterium SM1_1_3]NJN04212.1 hypothetical protein [Leptolyngbyaceae cyanobacterium RM1_1_2]NJO08340.1 hypothetical protein [Leptolyngbyaceae cyanobacterium SL_1_1]